MSVQEHKLILTLGEAVFQLRLKELLVNAFMYLSILGYYWTEKKQPTDLGSLLQNVDLHHPGNPYISSKDVAVSDIFTWALGACLEAEECCLAPLGLYQSPWAAVTVISVNHTAIRTVL